MLRAGAPGTMARTSDGLSSLGLQPVEIAKQTPRNDAEAQRPGAQQSRQRNAEALQQYVQQLSLQQQEVGVPVQVQAPTQQAPPVQGKGVFSPFMDPAAAVAQAAAAAQATAAAIGPSLGAGGDDMQLEPLTAQRPGGGDMGAGFGGTPAWGPEDTSGEFTEQDLADLLELEPELMQTGGDGAGQLGTPEGSGAATASKPPIPIACWASLLVY